MNRQWRRELVAPRADLKTRTDIRLAFPNPRWELRNDNRAMHHRMFALLVTTNRPRDSRQTTGRGVDPRVGRSFQKREVCAVVYAAVKTKISRYIHRVESGSHAPGSPERMGTCVRDRKACSNRRKNRWAWRNPLHSGRTQRDG